MLLSAAKRDKLHDAHTLEKSEAKDVCPSLWEAMLSTTLAGALSTKLEDVLSTILEGVLSSKACHQLSHVVLSTAYTLLLLLHQ